jgi:hypothetical protein
MLLNVEYSVTPIDLKDITLGDIIVIDWEGKNNPCDLRVGKVEHFKENFPAIRNQYGNISLPSSSWKNVKYYLVN